MAPIQTVIFMVRHAESRYVPGQEKARGISEKGRQDAVKVKELLQREEIDAFFSSPYVRAIQTLEPAAQAAGKEIAIIDELRERTLAADHVHIPGEQFADCKKRLYDDFRYALPGGESSEEAQRRGTEAFMQLLRRHPGKKLALGTHGDIMTLILNFFDSKFGFAFWRSTSMPDVYKLVFEDLKLTEVTRCWAD
ncbi:histidine phosphatase family protein [Paenibacillus sp. FSL W8-0194]|uniref:histidine phosphatase family protein n=1 Tax=Paenibacillus sp. FSL W8-0194 TaxID=2921711 RepID=UPI0030D7C750